MIEFRATFVDNAGSDRELTFRLCETIFDEDASCTNMAVLITNGASSDIRWIATPTISSSTIDNSANSYYVLASSINGDWTSDLEIVAVRIAYMEPY